MTQSSCLRIWLLSSLQNRGYFLVFFKRAEASASARPKKRKKATPVLQANFWVVSLNESTRLMRFRVHNPVHFPFSQKNIRSVGRNANGTCGYTKNFPETNRTPLEVSHFFLPRRLERKLPFLLPVQGATLTIWSIMKFLKRNWSNKITVFPELWYTCEVVLTFRKVAFYLAISPLWPTFSERKFR